MQIALPLFFLALASLLGPAPSARAVEIPEGVESNCVKGEFGANKYVGIKAALTEKWLENKAGEEADLVAVVLDFAQPVGNDKPEKISIAFQVTDAQFDKSVSPAIGGVVQSSGAVVFKWNRLDREKKPLPDGIYALVMNITGERYGDPLRGAAFPLYLTSGAPVLGDRKISAGTANIEFDDAPTLSFSSTGVGTAAVVDFDAEGNEINRWEDVLGPGTHTLKSDLLGPDDVPLEPGKYTTRVVMENPFGTSETFAYEYTLVAPPELEVAVKLDSAPEVKVGADTVIPFTVTLNQNAYLVVEHLADDGQTDLIGESTLGKPAVLYTKGTHTMAWRRMDMTDLVRYETGTHWIRVTAASLGGAEEIAESSPVTITPAPKPPAPIAAAPKPAKPQPVRTIPNLKLTVDPDNVLIGGRMLTRISYSFDQDSMIKLRLVDKRGKVVRKLKDSGAEHVKKGSYWVEIDLEKFEYGNYTVIFEANNFHGSRSASKSLSVVWRK